MQHFMLLLLKSVGLFSKKVFGVRTKLMGTAYYGGAVDEAWIYTTLNIP